MGDNSSLKALALATQFGFAVACPMLLFIGGGVWADDNFGTGHWLFFLGLVLGVAVAGGALYQIAASQGGKAKPRKRTTGTGSGEDGSDAGTTPANKSGG